MNQKQALFDTVDIAAQRGMPDRPDSTLGLTHLREMANTVDAGSFSAAKLGRWLGWAQAAVVASGVATLEEMKNLNRSHAGTPSTSEGES